MSSLPASIGRSSAAFSPRTVERSDDGRPDVVDDALDVLLEVVIDNASGMQSGLPVDAVFRVDVGGGPEPVVFSFRGVPAENYGADLVFPDGSAATVLPDYDKPSGAEAEPSQSSGPPPDHPSRWLEPITAAEYGKLEVLIGELRKLVDSSELNEEHQLRAQVAVDVLAGAYREVEAEKSLRAEIIPVAKSVLKFLAKELPLSITRWGVAIGVIQTDFPTLARELVKAIGG